jgi:hypothetical protein
VLVFVAVATIVPLFYACRCHPLCNWLCPEHVSNVDIAQGVTTRSSGNFLTLWRVGGVAAMRGVGVCAQSGSRKADGLGAAVSLLHAGNDSLNDAGVLVAARIFILRRGPVGRGRNATMSCRATI